MVDLDHPVLNDEAILKTVERDARQAEEDLGMSFEEAVEIVASESDHVPNEKIGDVVNELV